MEFKVSVSNPIPVKAIELLKAEDSPGIGTCLWENFRK